DHPVRALRLGTAANAARAGPAAARAQPVEQRGEGVQLLGVGVLGPVVLARVGPEERLGRLVRLVDQLLELPGDLQVDHTSTAPSISPIARRSRYHRSTGCSLT